MLVIKPIFCDLSFDSLYFALCELLRLLMLFVPLISPHSKRAHAPRVSLLSV